MRTRREEGEDAEERVDTEDGEEGEDAEDREATEDQEGEEDAEAWRTRGRDTEDGRRT